MSSRPLVRGLDLNTEAAPTVTPGNSVEETAAKATADGTGYYKDAGRQEETKVSIHHEVASAGGNSCNGIGTIDTSASGQGYDILPSEGEYGRNGVSNTRSQMSDGTGSIAIDVGAFGVKHESDDRAMASASSNQKLGLSKGAYGCEDSKRGHTCRSKDVDVIISEEVSVLDTARKSLRDQNQEHDNMVTDDKTGCLTANPEAPRKGRPSVKCVVSGSDLETSPFISYSLPHDDSSEFRVSDLIWGKVKSHPWWPGQIVDPCFASKLALKHQRKKDNHLVAYFGDKTFAWCDDSKLRPFSTFFSQMEKQSSNEGFRDSVNRSLYEVSRRVQMGMVCSCVPEKLYSELKVHNFDSSGVKKGISVSSVDKPECLQMFKPDTFLQYITTLARFPLCHTSWFDITVAHAQLMAYNRWEGHLKCSGSHTDKCPLRSKGESSRCKNLVPVSTLMSDFNDTLLCNLTATKTRSRGGSSSQKKHKLLNEGGMKEESSSQLVGLKRESHLKDGAGFRKRIKRLATSRIESGNNKAKKRRLVLFKSVDVKSPSPTPQKSFVIGECISRVASKLTSLPHNHKGIGDTRKKDKVDPEYDGPFSLDSTIPLSNQQNLIHERFTDEDISMSKLLSQFALAASDPLTIHDFCPIIVRFFTDVRLLQCSISNAPLELWMEKCDSGSAEGMEPPKEMKRRRGRPRKILPPKDNNFFPMKKLKDHSEIKRKRGRPRKSSHIENNENPSEGIKQLRIMKRERRRPAKYDDGEDTSLHRKNEEKRVRPTDGKKHCEEDGNKKTQVESVPFSDNLVMSMPDYLNDSYWTDVVVQDRPQKRKRGRKRREESLVNNMDSTLKPDIEPPGARFSTAISDTQTHHISSVGHNNSNDLVCERRVTYFGDKYVEEFNPTALVLNFSALCSLPSEMDLIRIFSRYGPLKESDTELQEHIKRAIVVFKRRADAELAFKEVPFSRFGPALLDFCLKNFPSQLENTQKVIAAGAKGTVPADGGNFEYSGSKNELFQGGSFQLEVTNASLGKTSSNSNMIDNLKQSLANPMDVCRPEILHAKKGELPSQKSTMLPTLAYDTISDCSNFQTVCSGGRTFMDMFLGNAQDPKRSGDRGQVKLELNANEMSIGDDGFVISCDPKKMQYQSSSVIANTFQVESAGGDNVEILAEEPSMKVDMAHVPGRRGGSMQCDDTGCSLPHSTSVETATKVCSSKKVMFSGGMHDVNDANANNQRPDKGLHSEPLVDNKNQIPLHACISVSVNDSTSADIFQMDDQDVKVEESHHTGSKLYDIDTRNLFSVDVCNFEVIEREKDTRLDVSMGSDGKRHAAAECDFEGLGHVEEPATVELIRSEVQGQKACKILAFDGDMEVPALRIGETNLQASGKGSANIKDSRHSLELFSDSGEEQAAQNRRSPYTVGTSNEDFAGDSKSDSTDLRLQGELTGFAGRKVNEIPGHQYLQ